MKVKRYLMSTGLICLLIFSFCPDVSAELSDGLVAYYPFNGNANDESGSENDGEVNGATLAEDRFGNTDSAFSFDGVDDYIDIGNNLKPPLPISVSLWVKFNEDSNTEHLFCNNFTNNHYYGVMVAKSPTGIVHMHFGDGGSTTPPNRRTKIGTSSLEVGEWYHIAVVFRGPTDMDIYINAMNDGGHYEGDGDSLAYDNNSGNIGRYDTGGSIPPDYTNSTIDDIRIYNLALSQCEIQCLYSGDPICTDTDNDCVLDDGDNSGVFGDNPCTTGTITNCDDNCPETPNGPNGGTCTAGDTCLIVQPCNSNDDCGTNGFCSMNQEDADEDGLGDACDFCEGDFTCDLDVDGLDAATFKADYGRSVYLNPCTNETIETLCFGDFDCDHDVDGTDAATFKADFGRSELHPNPCPPCEAGICCVYE